jgi:hypothetical protein
VVPAENPPYLTGTGYDDVGNLTGADIEFNITDIAETYTIPAVNNFFFP